MHGSTPDALHVDWAAQGEGTHISWSASHLKSGSEQLHEVCSGSVPSW